MIEPVVVVIGSKHCSHCLRLESIWDEVENEIRTVYPTMRFATFMLDQPGKFDETFVPSGLKIYNWWVPMVLLVPGPIWDQAVADIQPNSTVEIKDGVQIFNGQMVDTKLRLIYTFNGKTPADYGSWIRAAMQNEDFIRVQNL